jgi:type II secretion system protein L
VALLNRRRNAVIFAVPGAEVSLQEVEISADEKRHVAKSLPFLLEDEFASDIEDLHLASMFCDKLKLAVAACDDSRMQAWEELLAGLPPINLWLPEPLLLPRESGEACVLIEADQVLVRSGEYQGFAVEREMASTWLQSLAAEPVDSVIVYGLEQAVDMELIPVELQDRVQWRTGDFAAALMLSEESAEPLSLRQGRYGPSLPLASWWRQWRLAAAMLMAAFIVQVGASYAEYRSLETDNQQMHRQIESTYRQVAPQGAMSDPEKQLQRKLSGMKGGAQSGGFVPLLEQLGRVVQGQPGTTLSSINFTDKAGDLRVILIAPDFKAVEAIRGRLDKAGLQADLENSNTQGDAVRARLKVREK